MSIVKIKRNKNFRFIMLFKQGCSVTKPCSNNIFLFLILASEGEKKKKRRTLTLRGVFMMFRP